MSPCRDGVTFPQGNQSQEPRAGALARPRARLEQRPDEKGFLLSMSRRVPRIPTGTAHINDQTVQDEANAPFGGMRHSGNSARFGGAAANIEAYTDTRWITARSTVPD